MLVAALGSLLAALRGSGLGTTGFTLVWGPGSCGVTAVANAKAPSAMAARGFN